jgi:hypothetical protein
VLGKRLIAVAALAAALLVVAAGPARGAGGEADFLYDPGTVNVIELTLPQAGIEGLEDEPFEYQAGGTVVVTPTDGTPGGEGTPSQTFQNVEVKLKGKPGGSFQGIGGKAAFKLKFKKAEPFFGLRKLTLNNMTQDPSQIHESLAYTAFAAAGVPASRSGYAYVWLNGDNYGLHLNVESLDTVSLPRIFGAPFEKATQHLYEANEYGADFYPGAESRFEVDEGEDDTADLTALIAAVDAGGAEDLVTRLAAELDFGALTRMWGVEKYIGHWDGYAGQGIAAEPGLNPHRPNNYYLYSEPSGRFQMLPWGTDQTWGENPDGGRLEFDEQDGRLFDLCLEEGTCAGMFSTAVANALAKVGGLDLDAQAAATAAMLEPWQAMEAAPRQPHDSDEIAAAVAATREFIAERPAEAEAWLVAHPPPHPPLIPVAPDVETPNPFEVVPRTGEPTLPVSVIAVERLARGFRIRFHSDAAGEAVLRGRARIAGVERGVCRDERSVKAGREFIVVCRLDPKAVERLRQRALRVGFVAKVTLDAGGALTLDRPITLPRLRKAPAR